MAQPHTPRPSFKTERLLIIIRPIPASTGRASVPVSECALKRAMRDTKMG